MAYEGGDAAGAGLSAKKDLADRIEIRASGPGLYREGGYGKYIGRGVKDVGQAKSEIKALMSAGVDYIKIVHSGIYDPEADRITAGGLGRSELGEIMAYVRDSGLAAFCHANGSTAVQEAVDQGASAIIHGLHVSDETLSLMAEKRVVFIPTLRAFQSLRSLAKGAASLRNLEQAIEGHIAAVGRAHALGVKVLPGSDAGPRSIPYGTSFRDELGLLLKAGIPFEDVLRNASACVIEREQQADLLILEGMAIRHAVRQGEFLY
jgi:imidazolonepropionase-like amidohydrolase